MKTSVLASTSFLLICSILVFIFLITQMKESMFLEEKQAFECGFLMKWAKASSFSINYFFITMIFLLFDLEIVFIAPMGLYLTSLENSITIMLLVSYFSLLLAMEWMNSMLEWSK